MRKSGGGRGPGHGRPAGSRSRHWPKNLYIVPKHYFAIDVSAGPDEIKISAEHQEFKWATYPEACETLRYDDDKSALWELDARLRNADLPETTP